jgi:iron complex transport system permease protein
MKRWWPLVGLLVVAILTLLVTPLVPWQPIAGEGDAASRIFWDIRIPRVLLAFLAGAGLSVAGMTFQAMFRNPLATPFTLGIASGASLGAAIAIRAGLALSLFGIPTVSLFALLGALLTIGLIYGVTQMRSVPTTTTMLLAGVALSFFISSLILLLQYISDFTETVLMLRWVMGGLDAGLGFGDVLAVLPFVVSGCLLVLLHVDELNLLATGDELAAGRGVDVARTQRNLFLSASLCVGGVVAFCGPIGFIGLMAPHICRLVLGPDHRRLAPASILLGGVFLVLCDTVARTVLAPAELPVGILTALLGGPFFLWLLLSKQLRA